MVGGELCFDSARAACRGERRVSTCRWKNARQTAQKEEQEHQKNGRRTEREAEIHQGGREDHVALLGRETWVGAARCSGDDSVDFLDNLANLEVGILRRQLELDDQPIHLVEKQQHLAAELR